MDTEGFENISGRSWSGKRRLQPKMESIPPAKRSKLSRTVEPASSAVTGESEGGSSTQPSSQEETRTLEESFSVQPDVQAESERLHM